MTVTHGGGMVTRILSVLALLLVATAIVLGSLRTLHDRQIERLWETLRLPSGTALYDPKSVADLPVPAQRYFRHAIAPGTRLARSVVVEMQGHYGRRRAADKLRSQASQILPVPNALIWKAMVGEGIMQISGSDSYVAGEGA